MYLCCLDVLKIFRFIVDVQQCDYNELGVILHSFIPAWDKCKFILVN